MPPPSPRQLDVLGAYLDHGSVKEAAEALNICPSRTRTIMSALYHRIGVRNAAQATAWCDQHLPGWRVRAA
jgi:DNA-binding NarL/FixJ family response regulator